MSCHLKSPSPMIISGKVNTKSSCQSSSIAYFPVFLYTFHNLFRDMKLSDHRRIRPCRWQFFLSYDRIFVMNRYCWSTCSEEHVVCLHFSSNIRIRFVWWFVHVSWYNFLIHRILARYSRSVTSSQFQSCCTDFTSEFEWFFIGSS